MTTSALELALKDAIEELLDPTDLAKVLAQPIQLSSPGSGATPRVSLLHVRFSEDRPLVRELASFLAAQSVNYALSRRRRIALKKELAASGPSDIASVHAVFRSVRQAFIEFREKYPSRASEVGEVLAYVLAKSILSAAQIAAKMSLKTSPNMPVHGLDGIHAVYEDGALTVYFLESKLAATASSGSADYAKSVAKFGTSAKQYFREYEIVADLGNLDTLTGDAREAMLRFLDVMADPDFPRRERSVGVICYSETNLFSKKVPIGSGPVDIHEQSFSAAYKLLETNLSAASKKHLEDELCDSAKCIVMFVAVPNVDELRKEFYAALGIEAIGEPAKPATRLIPKKISARKRGKGK